MKKLSELLKRRDILTAQERERVELDAQIAALEAEEAARQAAEVQAAKAAAIAKARDGQTVAEQAVAVLVRDLAAALQALKAAEAAVGALTRLPAQRRVSDQLRKAVAHQVRHWEDWPAPKPVDRHAQAVREARASIADAQRAIKEAVSERVQQTWTGSLQQRKARLALLEGRDAEREPLRPEDLAMFEAMAERGLAGKTEMQLLAGAVRRQAERAQGSGA